jgi:hypothetical protein
MPFQNAVVSDGDIAPCKIAHVNVVLPADLVDVIGRGWEHVLRLLQQRVGHLDALVQGLVDNI